MQRQTHLATLIGDYKKSINEHLDRCVHICLYVYINTPLHIRITQVHNTYTYTYMRTYIIHMYTHNVSRLCGVMFFSFMLGCLSCQSKAVKQLYDVKCAKVNTLIRPDGQLVIGVFRVFGVSAKHINCLIGLRALSAWIR